MHKLPNLSVSFGTKIDSHRKKLATAGFLLLIEKAFRLTVSLLVWGYVANEMGTASFGKFSLFLSMIMLATPFTTLGIDQITKKRLVVNKNSSQTIVIANLFVRMLGFVFIGTLGVMLLIWTQIPRNDLLTISALYLGVLFRSGACFEAFLESVYATKIAVIARTISFVVSASLLATLAFFDASLFYFGLAVSLEFFISFLCLGVTCFRIIKKYPIKLSFRVASYLIKESRIILICDICTMFTMRSNQALVVYFISSAENGLFAVAVKFVEAWYFVPYALSAIVFPKIIEAQSISSEQFKRILQWAVEIFLIIAIAICVVTFLLAGPTITVFFGNYYEAAETHLKIMIFSTIFVFWGIILEPYEIAKKIQTHRLKRVVTGAILSMLLNVILIKFFGIKGASIALSLSLVYTYFISNFVFASGREFFKIQISAFLFPKLRSLISE